MRCLSVDAIKLLSAGATAVTPSHLLPATASRQFVDAKRSAQNGSWNRPAILSAQAWLTSLWKDRRYRDGTTPALLSTAQELLLWQQVIEQHGERLLDLAATARAARTAALTLAQYEVPLKDGRWQTHHDAEQFAKWLAEVKRRCAAERWTTMAGLWRLVPDWLSGGDAGNLRLLLFGFSQPFPALRRIIDAVRQGGGVVTLTETLASEPVLQTKSCETIERELEEAAPAARELVGQGAGSVGILVPGLSDCRKQVIRVFEDVFSPSHVLSVLHQSDDPQSLIRVDGIEPLRDHPVIAAALLVLDLATNRIPISCASAFLRSPFIAGARDEIYLRAQADLELRKYRDLDVSLRASSKEPRKMRH